MIRIDRKTRRFYLRRRRVHHGAVGVALVGLGCVLIHHDRNDWPWPFRIELD